MSASLPRPETEALAPFLEIWGSLPTTEDRLEQRLNSSFEQLQLFYDAMLPQLRPTLEYLNQFSLDGLSEVDKKLANAALAMCELDNAINKWGDPVIDTGIDIRRMVKKTSFNDRSA